MNKEVLDDEKQIHADYIDRQAALQLIDSLPKRNIVMIDEGIRSIAVLYEEVVAALQDLPSV